MNGPAPNGRKAAKFQLHFEKPPQFSITYNDKDDLFESFKNKLSEWNIPVESTYWIDIDGDHIEIKDADALLGVVMIGADTFRITVRDQTTDSSEKHGNSKKVGKKKKRGHKINRYQHQSSGHSQYRESRSVESSDDDDFKECCSYLPRYCQPQFASRTSYPPFHEHPFITHPPQMRHPLHELAFPFSSPFSRPPCCPCSSSQFPMDAGFSYQHCPAFGRSHHGHHGGMRGNYHGY